MDTNPYLSIRPRKIIDITVHPLSLDLGWDYTLELGGAGSIVITTADLNTLLLAITTTLYDNDHLSMDTAERVAYLTGTILADPRCDHCGVREQDSPLEWDGDTGNHVACQQQADDQPIPHADDYADEMILGEQYEEGR